MNDSRIGEHAALADVFCQFLNSGRDRYRKKDAQETGELGPDDQGEDDEKRRHADDARCDQGIDEVVLELLGDDVERDGQKPERDTSVDERDPDRRHRRQGRAEHRDYLEESRDDGEEKRVRHPEDRESEVEQDAHDDGQQDLPLHPKPYLPARTFPEIQDIGVMLAGRDQLEEIVHARFYHREVEREDDDENEREHAAEYARDCRECITEHPRRFGRPSHARHEIEVREIGRSRAEDARELVERADPVQGLDVDGKRGKERRQIREKRRHEKVEHAEKRREKENVDEEDREHARQFAALERRDRRLDGGSDDDGREENEHEIAQLKKKPRPGKHDNGHDDRAGRYRDDKGAALHSGIVPQSLRRQTRPYAAMRPVSSDTATRSCAPVSLSRSVTVPSSSV